MESVVAVEEAARNAEASKHADDPLLFRTFGIDYCCYGSVAVRASDIHAIFVVLCRNWGMSRLLRHSTHHHRLGHGNSNWSRLLGHHCLLLHLDYLNELL